MKKGLALMLALIMVLSLAGCSLTGLAGDLFGKKQEEPKEPEPVPQETPGTAEPAPEEPGPGRRSPRKSRRSRKSRWRWNGATSGLPSGRRSPLP